MTKPAIQARIRCTDRLGNVAYVRHTPVRGWACTLANGIPASLFYASVSGDEMACKFALEDAVTDFDALTVLRCYGAADAAYALV